VLVAQRVEAIRDLDAQMRRARDAQLKAVELQARAARAYVESVAAVSRTLARHGSAVRPARPGDGATAGSPVLATIFTGVGLSAVRRSARQVAAAAGLTSDALPDFVLAVQELMTNAVRHGGGWGRLRLWCSGDLLICTVTDHGPGFRAGPVAGGGSGAVAPGGRGLFLVRRLTRSIEVQSGPSGSVVTVTMELPAATGV
jgi:anti-sigma regulatory factor (Ser/Thr protein kinase)